jgi:hypothetical protein
LPATAPAEVRAADELHIGDLRALRSIELYVGEPLFSSKQQVDVVLASACCKPKFQVFSGYFRGMLQVFYMDVAKVDRYVAYVAMVVHVCCKIFS